MYRFRGLIITVILLAAVAAGCGQGKPDIELSTTAYDWGQVAQGDVATVELPVRNAGRGDLHIESVTTSCGCTNASVEPEVIPPGGEATLKVRYDSGVHPDEGPIMRLIYIASDDPDLPEAQVEVVAEVLPPTPTPTPTPVSQVEEAGPRISFVEDHIDLGPVPLGKMLMVHFVFSNEGDAPLIVEPEMEVKTIEGC